MGEQEALIDQIPPPVLETNKEYFRIAKDSTFLCKTRWYPERRNRLGKVRKASSDFHCTMQINSDIERALYIKRENSYTFFHPEFGVDEIKNTNMKIDILVDEKNCSKLKGKDGDGSDYFRELKK